MNRFSKNILASLGAFSLTIFPQTALTDEESTANSTGSESASGSSSSGTSAGTASGTATGTAAASDNCDTSVTVAYADSTAAGTEP